MPQPASLYVVRMKKITASEARKHWFRILDGAAQDEGIVLERKGRRLVLHREELDEPGAAAKGPDYRRLLRAPDADKADPVVLGVARPLRSPDPSTCESAVTLLLKNGLFTRLCGWVSVPEARSSDTDVASPSAAPTRAPY
jgi:hypothetical protein